MLMILYVLKGYLKFLMPLIDYTKESKYYYIINWLYQLEGGKKILWLCLCVDILAILGLVVWILKKNACKKLLIIEHSSLQRMHFSYNKEELEDFAVKKIHINQYESLNNVSLPLQEKLSLIISEVEISLPRILNGVEEGFQIGYAGIANIPATFFLGYKLGDENKKRYFHKFRKDSTDDDFHLLKDEDRQLTFIPKEEPNNPNKKGKLLLIVELTQPIKDDDISTIKEDNDFIIKFGVPETINYDIVDSSLQINQYTNTILSRVANIQKDPNIMEIKICIAASSSFVFALGTKFSKTQNKETVIYHYQNDGYPWGINVTRAIPVIRKEI